MEKIYWTIGEVAELLGEAPSAVRFWANSFPKYVKPARNAKGNRQFTAADVEALKRIRHLVKEEGLTLEGAARKMAGDHRKVDARVRALETLRSIRSRLVEVKEALQ